MMVHNCNTSEDTEFRDNLNFSNFEDRMAIGSYLKNKTEKQQTRNTEPLEASQYLTSNSTTEVQSWKQPGIGIRTDRRNNGTK